MRGWMKSASDIKFFSADVAIRREADGLTRIYRSDHETRSDDGSFNDFVWSDGNFACDCNRHDFFERAAGVELSDEESENVPCGDDRFTIEWIKDVDTGEVLYSEDD